MVRRYMESAKRALQWGRIFFPLSSLRFYPPQFVLRDPVLEGVKAAFYSGYEVAVIVFKLKNQDINSEKSYDYQQTPLMKKIKRLFRSAVEKEISAEGVITLHDYYGDGPTLVIKVDYDSFSASELEYLTKKIIYHVESNLSKVYPSFQPIFDTGFMFVEKKRNSIQESLAEAHRQAIIMAEKKVKTNHNDMILTMNQIISKKNIRLLAQPIIDIETSEIRAWEMLCRGPQGTVLESPLSLFSVARQIDRLYDLEMIIIEKAFEQIKATRCKQDIYVNCTPLTLGNIQFTRDLKKIMGKFPRISPAQITFEVTENDSIEGLRNFIYNIKLLRLFGFRIAMDDTGSGYSNLNTISDIMPDIIKIDRSVIQNIHQSSLKESILKGLLLVAREAGSLVVAEGIEREEEAIVLKRHHVDLAQGYFYSPPTILKRIHNLDF